MNTQPHGNWQNRMMELLAELSVIKAADIKPEHRLREDLGMDSVSSMELVSMLAEEFDMNVSVEEAARVTTVQGAMDMARKHLENRA